MSYNIANLCKEEIDKLLESGILEVCPHCGQIFAVADGVEVGGELCCPDCGDQAVRCRVCGELVFEADAHYDSHDDNYVCDDCYCNHDFVVCEDCGRLVANWVEVDDGRKYVCHSCLHDGDYYCCDYCGDWYSVDRMEHDCDGNHVCESCYDEHYVRCDHCGRIIYYEDSVERNGNYYCEDCRPSRVVNEYGYKPDPIFLSTIEENGTGGTSLYMGVELETDDGDISDVVEHEYVYYKEDGSLSSDGVEIVSHPATLDFHENCLGWDKIADDFLSWGYRSHQAGCSCGLHVHVNRNFFGDSAAEQDLNIAKVVLLVNRFFDSHLVKFARRNSDQWAKKPESKIMGEHTDSDVAKIVRENLRNMGRYVAVNLQNRHTIEFRLFRGTLKVSTLFATLEFVDTLCRFAKQISLRQVDTIQWADIFAGLDREKYHFLFDYMAERSMEVPDSEPENQFVETIPWSADDPIGTAYYVDFNVAREGVYTDNMYDLRNDRAYNGRPIEMNGELYFKIDHGDWWDIVVPVESLYRIVS